MAISRIKIWAKEKLRFVDLNAEFNNIIQQGLKPDGIDAMVNRTNESSPVNASGSTVTTSTLTQEIEQLRFVIRRLFGTTYWYQDPGRILSLVPDHLNRILNFSGNTDEEALADYIRSGGLLNAGSWDVPDVVAADFTVAAKKFSGFGFNPNTGILALPANLTSEFTVSLHCKNLSNGDYIAFNPLLGVYLYRNGSGQLAVELTEITTDSETTKDVTPANSSAALSSTDFQNLAFTYKATGTASDAIVLYIDGTSDGGASGSALNVNPGTGGVWFFGCKPSTISWEKSLSMQVKPNLAATAWTLVGTDNATISSDGILQISTLLDADNLYNRTDTVDLNQQTIEMKVRVLEGDQALAGVTVCAINDQSMLRSLLVRIVEGGFLTVSPNTGLSGYTDPVCRIPLNVREFHLIRITSSGSPSPTTKIFVDGVQVFEFVNDTAQVSAADFIQFGVNAAIFGGDGNASVEIEWFAAKSNGAAVTPVEGTGSSGAFIDNIGLIQGAAASNALTALKSSAAEKVYGAIPAPGAEIGSGRYLETAATGTASVIPNTAYYFHSDGVSPVTISFDGFATGSHSSAFVALVVDSTVLTLVGETAYVGAASNVAVRMKKQLLLASGLHSVELYGGHSSGTLSVLGNYSVDIDRR